MSDWDFLPPELETEEVEAPNEWVECGLQPEGVPPLELEMSYAGAADLRGPAGDDFPAMSQRDFLKKHCVGWRNATPRTLGSIYKPSAREGKRLKLVPKNGDMDVKVTFDIRFLLEIFTNSYQAAIWGPILVAAMRASKKSDEKQEGNGDSSAT